MPVHKNEIEAESTPLLPLPVLTESTGSEYSNGHFQEGWYERASQVNGPHSGPAPVQMAPPALIVIQNSQLDDQLVAAVNDCNLDVVESLLSQQASANAVDSSSHLSCAQIATKSGVADVLKLLLEHQADANVKDNDQRSLLHLAVDGKHLGCLEVLLKTEKVNINCVDRQKLETPLVAAVEAGWLEGVELLMVYRPEIENKYGKKKISVLQQAIRLDNSSVVRSIVEGARSYENSKQIINVVNDQKMTPLFTAILRGKIDLVKILLQARADVTLRDKFNRNVLHCAAEKSHSGIIEVLYQHNRTEMMKLAQKKQAGQIQSNPLHIAINKNDYKSIKYLIEKGSTKSLTEMLIDIKGYKNCNVLHFASITNKKEAIKFFTEMLSDPSETLQGTVRNLVCQKTGSGETPLHFALQRQQISFVASLIVAGSDLTAKYDDKNSCRTRTAIDMLIHQLPSSVQFLSDILDSSIKKNRKSMSVVVDYKILMPPVKDANVQNGDSFGVLNALRKTGDRLGQKKLLEHPLVESFVHLHWKRLQGPYIILVVLNVIFAILLSLLVLFRLILKSPETIFIMEAFMIACMVPLFIHEFECVAKNQPWSYRVESVMRSICFALTIWTCFPKSPLEYSAFAVLLAWFEVILLISRIPYQGYFMLMFIEIAFKYIKLLGSFVFVIFGFVIAFMALFELQSPFDSFWPALMKTIVMMTNEFEYDNLSTKFSSHSTLSPFSKMLAMGVFILFTVFIGLVLTNLFVAVAVIDIKKLHIISKQTEFLGVYETFLLSKPWWSLPRGIILFLHRGLCALVRHSKPKLVETWDSFTEVQPIYRVQIDEQELKFPEELNSAIVVKGYESSEKLIKKFTEDNKNQKDFEAAEKFKLKEKQSLLEDLKKMITAVIEERVNMTRLEVNQVELKNGY